MRISQLSAKTGVSIRSIRHYEKRNLLKAERLENGYREFDPIAVDRVNAIRMYLDLGLNTEQIEEIFNCHDENLYQEYEELCDEMLELYQNRLSMVTSQIHTLENVKKRLETKIGEYQNG